MQEAILEHTNIEDADLSGVSMDRAQFGSTRLFNVDLSVARGLESCIHLEPSFVDRETLALSDRLPDAFLRGIGLLHGFGATVIRVAVGSPSDVSRERRRARVSIYEWNDTNSALKHVVLLPVLWEYHATPELGDHPQPIIDRQLLHDSQILVAIFWSRIGSPTPMTSSGTVSEIEKFVSEGKPVLVYFCTKPIPPENIDMEQWASLSTFKKDLQNHGLIGHFESLDELDRKLKQHLTSTIDRLYARGGSDVK